MRKTSKEPGLDKLRGEVRQVGLRATGARVAVLRCLHRMSDATSHADLATQLAPEGWDRATVYRNLIDLTEAGLLARVDHGDHTWRYTLRKNAQKKYGQIFFVCDVSGETIALPPGCVSISPSRGAPKALRDKEYVIYVRGVGDKHRK